MMIAGTILFFLNVSTKTVGTMHESAATKAFLANREKKSDHLKWKNLTARKGFNTIPSVNDRNSNPHAIIRGEPPR